MKHLQAAPSETTRWVSCWSVDSLGPLSTNVTFWC
jgi:hypothetical protein